MIPADSTPGTPSTVSLILSPSFFRTSGSGLEIESVIVACPSRTRTPVTSPSAITSAWSPGALVRLSASVIAPWSEDGRGSARSIPPRLAGIGPAAGLRFFRHLSKRPMRVSW